jgi:hypothetical protein
MSLRNAGLVAGLLLCLLRAVRFRQSQPARRKRGGEN